MVQNKKETPGFNSGDRIHAMTDTNCLVKNLFYLCMSFKKLFVPGTFP